MSKLPASFRAYVVDRPDGGAFSRGLRALTLADLPPGEVTVRVEWSGVNFKEGLAAREDGRVARRYPLVPGSDLAGTVVASADDTFPEGSKVLAHGYDIGTSRHGGYADLARVPSGWTVALPDGLTTRDAMAIGTAGFTAMLAVMALEDHGLTPASGEVLVTGAAGGVGSAAIAILARRGYKTVASSGRPEARAYLESLGATTVIDRAPFADPAKRPLESERWAGCVDSVGGNTLTRVLAQTRYGGSAAAVGLAGGTKLEHTVIPFLLRGVNLLGIDSVMCPMPRRLAAWSRLQSDLPLQQLEAMTTEAGLADVPRIAQDIVAGQVRGRVVINVNR